MSQPAYDEIFDERGHLRPGYAALRCGSSWDPLRPSAFVAEQLRDRPLGDDARILPVPWVIDDVEYVSVIQHGVAQRARALQMFFADMVLGGQQFLTSTTTLTAELFAEILAFEGTTLDSLRQYWVSQATERLCFVYGPDLVRSPHGRWTVLEDNIGCVGGTADSYFVADAYARAIDRPMSVPHPPESDLSIAIRRWMQCYGQEAMDRVIALFGCESDITDVTRLWFTEDVRRRGILDALGIDVRVGTQVQQLWEAVSDSQHPTAIVNFDMESEAARTNLYDIGFRQRNIPLLNAPGTGLLGNKALLPYVDDMIRLYCAEEPIFETPEVRFLSDGVLPDEPNDWVVKQVTGCQGTTVFVLKRRSRAQVEVIQTRMQRSWSGSAAVAQRYVEPSRLAWAGSGSWDAFRLELRPIAYILGWQDVYVGEYPVGKAISNLDARGLNNISQGACYVPVLRQHRSECVNAEHTPDPQ